MLRLWEKPIQSGQHWRNQVNAQPGFIRIDTVHQGDQVNQKDLHHINAVDEVTQFEAVSAVERICEQYLFDAGYWANLDCFPFLIQDFHSDNGSEYITYKVAKLL